MQQTEQHNKVGPFDLIHAFATAWASTIYMPWRWRVGKDHPGLLGIVGIGVMVLFSAFHNEDKVMYLLPIYLGAILIHRLHWYHLRRRGDVEHSFYDGWPWLVLNGNRHLTERTAKLIFEPFVAMFIGMLLFEISDGLAKYFIYGALAMVCSQLLSGHRIERRIDHMRNAMIEARLSMGMLKGRRTFA